MTLNAADPTLPRAITVRVSVDDMKARRGPLVAHYNMPLDRGRTYRWIVDESTLVADDIAVIEGNGQGNIGRWVLVREPTLGANIADATPQTLVVGEDFWRRILAIPLTQNIVLTLGTTNAEAGDIITLTRLDVAAFTVTVLNGGPGAGTLVIFPDSLQAFGDFEFDGTNWLKKRAATMLA